MKRFLCFLLTAAMLLCLVACCDDAEESDEATPSESSSPVVKKEPTVNGIKLSEFTVIYKNNSGDAAKFIDAAKSFVEQVKKIYGVSLKYLSDSSKETANEIIFGVTEKRDICKDKTKRYDIGEYKVEVKGTKILFAATYANGALGAGEAFLSRIYDSEQVSDMNFEGEKNVIRVACVGDSITYGATSTNKNKNYPAFLQDMLGLDYYVFNAGISGYSIVSTDQYAYKKSVEFQQAKSFKPDVVLFALGTNDANPTTTQPYKNWEDPANDRTNKFIQSTNELLDAFIGVNPDVQIIMLLPTSLFKVPGDQWKAEEWTANINKYVTPNLKKIAEERKIKTVDLYSWSLNNKEIFVDGLHPKDDTYKPFAKFIYESIKNGIKKP